MAQPSDHPITAIVSLDLHGYSRLSEQDEIGTHRALMTCMRKQLRPLVDGRGGEIVKSTGDGALIRFPNAPAAVQAMIRFQQNVAASEASFPESRRLVFRIGIHVAPLIHDDGDVFGHGVNLAVRLQESAEPGSIVLSDAVTRCLDPDLSPPLKKLGKRTFKNIEEKVEIHRWPRGARLAVRDRESAAGLMAVALLVGMVLPTAALDDVDAVDSDRGNPVEKHILNEPRLHQPVKSPLTIAGSTTDVVLPTIEEGWLMSYHGLNGGPLGVDIKSTMAGAERSLETRSEIAEDAYLQALALYRRHTPEALARAIGELEQALRLKPGHDPAHTLLAAVYWGGLQNRWQLGRGMTRVDLFGRAKHHLSQAARPDPFVHMVQSEMLTAKGRHDLAIGEAKRAIAIGPSRAIGHYAKGRALLFAGRAAEAAEAIRAAIRLDPGTPRYLFGLALAQFSMNRFNDAERTLRRATAQNGDDDWAHLLMAATQGYLGAKTEARLAIGRFDRLSLVRRGWFASQIPYVHSWPFRDDEDRDRLHLGMVLAGIPEVGR